MQRRACRNIRAGEHPQPSMSCAKPRNPSDVARSTRRDPRRLLSWNATVMVQRAERPNVNVVEPLVFRAVLLVWRPSWRWRT